MWIISNSKRCRAQGLPFGVPSPTHGARHPSLCQPLAMAQMETQRGNKGETTNPKISDRFKHFRVGNLLIISTSLSRDCEILQRPRRAQNPHTLENCGFLRTSSSGHAGKYNSKMQDFLKVLSTNRQNLVFNGDQLKYFFSYCCCYNLMRQKDHERVPKGTSYKSDFSRCNNL